MAGGILTFGSYIGGEWLVPTGRDIAGQVEIIDIAGAHTVTAIHQYAADFGSRAVTSAAKALPDWRRMPLEERIARLQKVVDGIPVRKEEVARSIALGMGKPIAQALAEVDAIITRFNMSLPIAREVIADVRDEGKNITAERRGRGVAVGIGPNNYPARTLFEQAMRAMIVGCTFCARPPRSVAEPLRILAEILHIAGSIPAGGF